MSISEDVAFHDLMESKRKASLTSQNLIDFQPSQSPMKEQSNPSCWDALQSFRDLNVNTPLVDCLLDLRKQITEKDKPVKCDESSRSIKIIDRLFGLGELLNVACTDKLINEIVDSFEKEDLLLRLEYFVATIEDVIKGSQEIKNKLQSRQVVIKDHDSANDRLVRMLEWPAENTIIIDGVTYYSAKHYKPVSGEMVIGFTKPFTSYEANDDWRNNGLPSYWRPMPEITWYSSDKSCWLVPCGSSHREENIKAWTKLPHPERTKELFDFMDRI
jgi:hypothetical protein